MRRQRMLLCFMAYSGYFSNSSAQTNAKRTIVLDAGHSPKAPGAIGICGRLEVKYNDQLVAAVQKVLGAKYNVVLTRKPLDEIASQDHTIKGQLAKRADIANQLNADLFISIHHDSVPERFLTADSSECKNGAGRSLGPEFKKIHHVGYNVFISKQMKPGRQEESLRLAEGFAKKLKAIGRTPSDYHGTADDDCKSCEALDKENGVWAQNLAVLRETSMPAMLVEAGIIVDEEDERKINNDAFRSQFATALAASVDEYFRPKGAVPESLLQKSKLH